MIAIYARYSEAVMLMDQTTRNPQLPILFVSNCIRSPRECLMKPSTANRKPRRPQVVIDQTAHMSRVLPNCSYLEAYFVFKIFVVTR